MKFKSLIFIVLAASMTCTDIYAENNRPIDIALWENGPLEKNDDEGKTYDENVRIYRPSIKVFLPEGKNTGRAVIMCPGGGYALLAYDHEGYAYAGNHKVPMSDVCEAMRVVKSHAAEWKINPDDIGIMGFSAGGHLASTFATHYPAELRPAFQILVYPVISMDETITHSGSRENLIGKNPSKALIDYYSNEKHVNAESPRAFIALSDDDRAVPVENSLRYQIPVSLHIYPTGGHGWGYNESFRFKKAVHDELADWLRSF